MATGDDRTCDLWHINVKPSTWGNAPLQRGTSLRVLLECYACDPTLGSEPFYGWRWARALAEAGHDVQLLVADDGVANLRDAIGKLAINNIEMHVVPRSPRLLRLRHGYYLDYARWLDRAVRCASTIPRCDLAHHITWGSVTFGTRLWELGIPTVLGPCGGGQVMPSALRAYLEEGQAFEWTRTALVRSAHRFSALPGSRLDRCHVLATNEDTAQLARKRKALSVELFPDPVLDERDLREEYTPRPSRARPQLLWVGRMLPRKGIELALRAFAKAEVQADLTVVGDGPRMTRARELVRELNVESSVRITGAVPREQVGALMRDSDLFVFSSLRDSTGVQLLEAMVAGLPIICFDAFGASALVPEDAGVRIPVINADQVVEDLARAIRMLVVNPEWRTRMGRRAHREALEHQWSNKINRIEAVYQRVLTEQR